MKQRLFAGGERKKMVSESTKDYFLLNDRIYPVDTMTQRAKLESLKEGIEFQEEKKYTPTPIRKPTAPKINLHQQLSQLTLKQKKLICTQIEQNLNIQTNPFLKRFETEMTRIKDKIQEQNSVNLKMLSRLSELGQLSDVECQNKMEFFNKLLIRKQGFMGKITKLFTDIYTKQYRNDRGQITLHQLLYSNNSLSQICSSEKIRSESEIVSEKELLIKQIAQKLDLVSNHKPDNGKGSSSHQPFSLECEEVFPKLPFSIPLIMTKDRKEEMEREEEATQKKLAQCEIEQRITTQLSLIIRTKILDSTMVDTSLAAVGTYLTSLNVFVLQNYFQDIIELINMPYGKPAFERLSELQGANLGEDILPYILSDKLFQEFQEKMNSNECERMHHKVLFDALNFSLNVYRPYFNFKGEIYPWLVTEKGMTFYSISQANIEEVLDKCKITIMEKAASLCGVLSSEAIHQKAKAVYESKRNEKIQKIIQQEIAENCVVETEEEQAKMMLGFGKRLLDWLIEQTVHEIKTVSRH